MAGREGESYLDELLDNASTPPQQAEIGKNNAKKKDFSDVGLDEALAVLNDLPDETGIPSKGNPKEELEELKSLFEEFGDEEIPEPQPEMEVVQEPEEEPEVVQEQEEVQEPEQEPEEVQELEQEPEGEPKPEEDTFNLEDIESFTSDREPDSESLDDVEFEDMEAMLNLLQQPEKEVETQQENVPKQTEEPKISKDPVAVDDIFQDALSAVGYSADEEELEQQMRESSEQPHEEMDSTVEDIFALEDVMQESEEHDTLMEQNQDGVQEVPARKPKKEKKNKKRFWKRLFGNVITDETAALEEKERQKEEADLMKKQAALIEKKKQAQVKKEEKEKKAQEDKERKKQLKEEKAVRKEEKKAEKKRLKEERAAMAENEVVGKINPIGATIVFVLFATIGVFILIGVWLLPRRASIKQAENQYANEQYIDAYQTISAISVKKDEQTFYDKIVLCSKLQRQIQSYQTNVSMEHKLEALHALLQGLDFYNKKQDDVKKMKVQKEFLQMKTQILSYLVQDYQIDEAKAGEILTISDETEYTKRLQEIVSLVK